MRLNFDVLFINLLGDLKQLDIIENITDHVKNAMKLNLRAILLISQLFFEVFAFFPRVVLRH